MCSMSKSLQTIIIFAYKWPYSDVHEESSVRSGSNSSSQGPPAAAAIILVASQVVWQPPIERHVCKRLVDGPSTVSKSKRKVLSGTFSAESRKMYF